VIDNKVVGDNTQQGGPQLVLTLSRLKEVKARMKRIPDEIPKATPEETAKFKKAVQFQQPADKVTVYALMMAFGTMTSRVLGLVRDQLFAAMFTATVRDAWAAAFRLPNMFRRLLGEGSMSVSFIPIFVQTEQDDPTGVRAKNLVNSFYTLLLLVLATLTAVGTIWPEAFLNVMLDPAYSNIPGKFELTVRMARIMFSFIFFMSTYAYFMGILNALGKYGLAALAPTFFNIAMIISNFVPQKYLASPGDAISCGVVIGGALQAGILIPVLWKLGFLPKLSFDFSNKDVMRILRNMVPGMLGLGLLQITTIVNLRFASSLGEGPITYIWLADRLLELPLSLVSVSLGTALLPTLAGMWSRGEQSKMTNTANYYLRLNLYVAVPAAVGLFVLANPIVEVLFQRGKFIPVDAAMTASVVRVYAFILMSTSCVRVLIPSFYAIKNTWLPACVSGVCLVVHLFLAPYLMANWGLQGLVSSSFVTGSLNLTILFIAYRILIGPFHLVRVAGSLLKFVIAGSGLYVVLQIYPVVLEFFGGQGFFAKLISLCVCLGLGGAAYFGLSHALKIEEYRITTDMIFKKIKSKFSKAR
jgi:putative peptidoglycan lipid II flippase